MGLFLSLVAGWAAWQSPIAWSAPVTTPSANPSPRSRVHKTVKRIEVPLLKVKTLPPAAVGFKFVAAGKTGLMLQFFSNGRPQAVDQSKPMIFELSSDQGVRIEPAVISNENWPQVSKPLPLELKGATRGNTYQLHGVASYVACSQGDKKACKRYKSSFDLKYTATK